MEQRPFEQTPISTPPKNWLVESILVTIFCCIPLGIVGIVFASQVNSKWASGDHAGAVKASQEAGKWTKIAFFAGLAVIVLSCIFYGSLFWSMFRSGNFNRNY